MAPFRSDGAPLLEVTPAISFSQERRRIGDEDSEDLNPLNFEIHPWSEGSITIGPSNIGDETPIIVEPIPTALPSTIPVSSISSLDSPSKVRAKQPVHKGQSPLTSSEISKDQPDIGESNYPYYGQKPSFKDASRRDTVEL